MCFKYVHICIGRITDEAVASGAALNLNESAVASGEALNLNESAVAVPHWQEGKH
jgi:hypothetical protein